MTRRRALMARVKSGERLPSEYQEVEYIEGTGTQYIDTMIPAANLSLATTNWTLRLTPTITDRVQIFAGVGNNAKQLVDFRNRLREDWCGYEARYFSSNIKTDAVNKIMQKDGLLWLNNESAQIDTTTTSQNTFYLFGKNTGSYVEASTIAHMKLYGFTAQAVNAEIADFVPCYRKLDNKPGMYDIVSQTFFTNAGTGEFQLP